MGYGSLMTCRKCQNTYQLFTGCGMGYHLEYEKTMKQIKSGKFGKRMQEIANDDEFVAVDVERKLYVCENCGDWSVEQSCDLYRPKDRAVVIQNKINECGERNEFLKTISYDSDKNEIKTDDGRIVSVAEVLPDVHLCGRNKKYYRRILKFRHQCHKCGEVMRETKKDENVELKCPDCGEHMSKNISFILWD